MKTSTERKVIPYKRESHLPVRRETVEPFGLLRREIDRLFEDFTRGFTLEPLRVGQFTPVVDMSETGKNVTFTVELPGMDEKDVTLSTIDGHLMIRGEKKEETEEEHEGYYRSERSFGEFSRLIPVPTGVDTGKLTTVFKKGLLTITIPKTKRPQLQLKRTSSRRIGTKGKGGV